MCFFQSMAVTNMDMNQTELFLTSQTKKKDGAITGDQAKVLLKFWKTHRTRIHKILVERCSWNNKLKEMSWRIDVQNKARHTEQTMIPTAIVELQLQNRESENKVKIIIAKFYSNLDIYYYDNVDLYCFVFGIEYLEINLGKYCV